MDKALEEKKKMNDAEILFLLRGYFVPIFGVCILLLTVIFIYVPNILNIKKNIDDIQQKSTTFDTLKQKITYYNNLSTPTNQTLINNNVQTVNTFIPDTAKGADALDHIQTVVLHDGLQVVTANASYLQSVDSGTYPGAYPSMKMIQMSFHVVGTADQAKQMFDDIFALKEVKNVYNVSIVGAISQNASDQITFSADSFSLDINDVAKSISLLNTVTTSYTEAELNNL